MFTFFFRVRQRDDKKTFALTLSFRNEARHYMIDKKEKFAIQDGPKFDCLMMVGKKKFVTLVTNLREKKNQQKSCELKSRFTVKYILVALLTPQIKN